MLACGRTKDGTKIEVGSQLSGILSTESFALVQKAGACETEPIVNCFIFAIYPSTSIERLVGISLSASFQRRKKSVHDASPASLSFEGR